MKATWTPVKELFSLARRSVEPEVACEYREIGVRSFGKGLFIKDPVTGLDLGSKRVFLVKNGDFIVSNVFAWEGAVGLAGPEHDGFIGSHRFMTWVPKSHDFSTRYVLEYFRSQIGVSELGKASPGSAGRNRTLSIKNFEEILVPLPSRSEQDRIAAHLDSLARVAGPGPSSLGLILQRDWPGKTYLVGDLVTSEPRSEAVDPDATYELSGVKWYGQGLFIRETKTGRELSAKTVRRVTEGDLIYNRLFAWKQSFALATASAWVSNEFPTFRINTSIVRPRVLLAALLGPAFTTAVNAASTGSTPTSRNRLKEKDFLNLEISIPSASSQSAVEKLLLSADHASVLQERVAALSTAILPAARNEIFSALSRD